MKTLQKLLFDNLARWEALEYFIKSLEEQEHLLTEFDSTFWGRTVESVTISAEDDVKFTFKDGSENLA